VGALHLALQPLQLRLGEQPRQLDQPHRRIAPYRVQQVPVIWPPNELPQCLQEWQVRFPLPIVLDALPPRDPCPIPGGQAGQPPLHHRRLAHPGRSTDKHQLADALGCPPEP